MRGDIEASYRVHLPLGIAAQSETRAAANQPFKLSHLTGQEANPVPALTLNGFQV